MITHEKARPSKGGYMVHKAKIQTEGSMFMWVCTCRPIEAHDHEKIVKDIETRLIVKDEIVRDYQEALDDQTRRVGLLKYQIKSYGVKMAGYKEFTSFVRWSQWPLDDPTETLTKGLDFESRDPADLPDATDVLCRVNETLVDEGMERSHYLHGLSHR
jgi:hypothetical protein